LLRLANPLVRAILRSRAHGLLSRRLLLLSYHGHRSGRLYEIPLRYVETADGRLVTIAVDADKKLWWRSFHAPSPALVLLRRDRLVVWGAVAEDTNRANVLARYVAGRARVERASEGAAVVVFTPEG
jgi:hypothetical protein